jgi:hypothetical protein
MRSPILPLKKRATDIFPIGKMVKKSQEPFGELSLSLAYLR